ncbi:hypothetical protein NW755_003854 [Fusarium falciforme]|uniref:Uncharacterized protein n=1 Tax=Fusarium falciforme TaxID=195108 RepID=A0A9W8RDZ1_9HYPO|nr:hypothetical protein NW755_003854 [Fusarium falciforme]KAJ4250481.1 hypothetical protein NW757_007313 [Fusarium falciforme]
MPEAYFRGLEELRAATAIIAKPSDLTAEKNGTAMDLLRAWARSFGGGIRPSLTLTFVRVPTKPRDTALEDSAIEVGIVSVNAFNSRRIERGQPETVQPHQPYDGQTAYLGLTLNLDNEVITWYNKREGGKWASPTMVEYTVFQDKASSALLTCVNNYDSSHRRAESNVELLGGHLVPMGQHREKAIKPRRTS